MSIALSAVTNKLFEQDYTKVLRRWLPLLPILALAFSLRINLMPDLAYQGDIEHFAVWMNLIKTNGLFQFYEPRLRFGAWDRAYPPLSIMTFDAVDTLYGHPTIYKSDLEIADFITLIKVVPVTCDMVLIIAVFAWLRKKRVLSWLIPLLLAIYPGLLVTSAWWGQYEAPFTLFLCLSLIAMNQKKPMVAWAMFAIAVLFKQPAAPLLPILLVLTFKRYGLRPTINGIAVFVAICMFIFWPFVLESGPVAALSSYLNASDAYPNMTNNAYNLWYVGATLNKGAQLIFEEKPYIDSLHLIGSVTYKQAGLVMFGAYVLLISIMLWKRPDKDMEFVWGAAMFLGFFIFPTQVHERYIFPAAMLSLLAASQDRRFWWFAVGIGTTFSLNVFSVIVNLRWNFLHFGSAELSVLAALLNIAMLIAMGRLLWLIPLRNKATAPAVVPVSGQSRLLSPARMTED